MYTFRPDPLLYLVWQLRGSTNSLALDVCMVIPCGKAYGKAWIKRVKIADPVRGQLKRKHCFFPVFVRA